MPEEKQHKAATAAPKKTDEAKPEGRELKEKELEQIAGGTSGDLGLHKRRRR